MNKKTIRIAGWALGLSMAVAGIGATVGATFRTDPIQTCAVRDWEPITLSTSGGTSASEANVKLGSGDTTGQSALKAGTSKQAGAVVLDVGAYANKLKFFAAGWNAETVTITATTTSQGVGFSGTTEISLTSDTGVSGNSPFTLSTPSNFTTSKELTLTGVGASGAKIKITATSGKRFVLWGAFYSSTTMATSISISPTAVKLKPGDSQQITPTLDPDSSNERVTYSSSNNDVATVNENGLITAVADGTATITASVDAGQATCSVTVETPTEPFVGVSSALAGYTGKSATLDFTYGQFTKDLLVTSTDTSKVTVDAPSYSNGNGSVGVNFLAAGSSTLKFWHGDDEEPVATCEVTVTLSEVSSVTWDGANFTCYSGSSITADMVAEWNPEYEMNNGDPGSISSDYTIKIGGTDYTLGSPLTPADSGKTVTLTYGNVTTSANNPVITVVQSLNPISKLAPYSYTFTEKVFTSQTTKALGDVSWTLSGSGSVSYYGYDGTKGQQFGAGGAAYSSMTLTASAGQFGGAIKKIEVYASTASSATATISTKVNGASYGGDAQSLTTSNAKYTFEGNASGSLAITISQPSTTKALYIKSIAVTTDNDYKNIANHTSHFDAQSAVVGFAQYVNTEMNKTNVCSGTRANLGESWGNISDKYDELFGAGSSLSAAELTYAKDMLANSTAEWNESHDSDQRYCLERAMKTYEFCVKNHAGTCTAFLSAVRPVASAVAIPYVFNNSSDSPLPLVLTIAAVGTVAAGGLLILAHKRRNED